MIKAWRFGVCGTSSQTQNPKLNFFNYFYFSGPFGSSSLQLEILPEAHVFLVNNLFWSDDLMTSCRMMKSTLTGQQATLLSGRTSGGMGPLLWVKPFLLCIRNLSFPKGKVNYISRKSSQARSSIKILLAMSGDFETGIQDSKSKTRFLDLDAQCRKRFLSLFTFNNQTDNWVDSKWKVSL